MSHHDSLVGFLYLPLMMPATTMTNKSVQLVGGFLSPPNDNACCDDHCYMLRLQTIKAIVNSRSFQSLKSDEPRRMQVLDLYCLTRFESESSSKGTVY